MLRRKRLTLLILAAVVLLIGSAALAVRPPSVAAQLDGASSKPAPALAGAMTNRPKRILVIGASSGIGLATAQLAAARGHLVTAMSRSAPETTVDANPRVVRGDILDPAAVAAATLDIDAVVISIGAPPSRQVMKVFSQGTGNVLTALASRPDVPIFVVTGIGAGDSRGHGGFGYDRILQPLLLKQIYLDKDREEALLQASPARFTIVRPGFLTDDRKTTPYRAFTRLGELRSGAISRAQVAQFIVAALEQDLYPRETVLLTR